MITKVPKRIILPKINSANGLQIIHNSNNLSQKYLKHTMRTNIVKLKPIENNNLKKSRAQCIDAEEYLRQIYSITEIYDINDFNNKLIYLKKILLEKNIFLLKTGWDSVWDNTLYSLDKAEEMIYERYQNIIGKRYELYNDKYNLSEYKYPLKLMHLIYTKELVSFVMISDYSIYLGKIFGFIKLNFNYININEKNCIFNSIKEIFPDKYIYDSTSNTINIQLKKNNFLN